MRGVRLLQGLPSGARPRVEDSQRPADGRAASGGEEEEAW